ncbi:MAG: glycosyltransferase [Candidatus Kapabacteria bacterium]|nr:glycosyltransferase [Candidatus Kapabacteria bacterium]
MINPKVTILVPFYKQAEYVQATLDGCVNQDYDNFEIVVRDDFSNDGTAEKILDYVENSEKKHLFTFVDIGDKNLGLTKSTNRLLKSSTGEIIVLNGGDDISFPERTKKAIELIKKYNVDLIGSDAISINHQGNIIRNTSLVSDVQKTYGKGKYFSDDNVYLFKDLDYHTMFNNSYGGYSLVFKRNLLDVTDGILPENLYNEDYFLIFLSHINNGSLFYAKPLLYRRLGKFNLSQRNHQTREKSIETFLFQNEYHLGILNEELKVAETGNYKLSKDKEKIINVLKGYITIKHFEKNAYSKGNYFNNFQYIKDFIRNSQFKINHKFLFSISALFPFFYREYRLALLSQRKKFVRYSKF